MMKLRSLFLLMLAASGTWALAADDVEVSFTPEQLEASGIKTEAVKAAKWTPAWTGYGRVLDPAPLARALMEVNTARATAEASVRERDRLQRLHDEGENAAARDVEEAALAARRDLGSAELAGQNLASQWGMALAGRRDLGELVGRLVRREAALVTIELAPGANPTDEPKTVSVSPVAGGATERAGTFLGYGGPDGAAALGPVLLVLVEDANGLTPGRAVLARVSNGEAARSGVCVPAAALVRYRGSDFVFVAEKGGEFRRQAVETGGEIAGGRFVGAGLKPGDEIVVTGAQQVLSAGLGGAGAEEDEN